MRSALWSLTQSSYEEGSDKSRRSSSPVDALLPSLWSFLRQEDQSMVVMELTARYRCINGPTPTETSLSPAPPMMG